MEDIIPINTHSKHLMSPFGVVNIWIFVRRCYYIGSDKHFDIWRWTLNIYLRCYCLVLLVLCFDIWQCTCVKFYEGEHIYIWRCYCLVLLALCFDIWQCSCVKFYGGPRPFTISWIGLKDDIFSWSEFILLSNDTLKLCDPFRP